MSESYAIGVDIGGTKLAFALIDRKGKVLDAFQMPTLAEREPAAIISDIAVGIQRLAANISGKVCGIGIGSPGQVFSEKGLIMNAVNLGWSHVSFESELRSLLKWDVPIYLLKDADASLIGEYLFGAAQGISDFMYICIGSGLGGAIMANHDLVAGSNGTAAGIGHITIKADGRICSCGLQGCAETIISGPGLVKETRELIKNTDLPTTLKDNAELTPTVMIDAARSGDVLARHAFSTLSCGLGRVISYCISILNPAMIVIGGGLGLASFDIILPEALKTVKQHALPHTYQGLQILPSKQPSSALGPASLVWYFEKNNFSKGRRETIL
jgi:glucokinase